MGGSAQLRPAAVGEQQQGIRQGHPAVQHQEPVEVQGEPGEADQEGREEILRGAGGLQQT